MDFHSELLIKLRFSKVFLCIIIQWKQDGERAFFFFFFLLNFFQQIEVQQLRSALLQLPEMSASHINETIYKLLNNGINLEQLRWGVWTEEELRDLDIAPGPAKALCFLKKSPYFPIPPRIPPREINL